jgi:chromosome partitioning protein
MKTISIVNQKGGVGKTASTIHIGATLALKDPTLLIDFDPQMNLSQGYKISPDYSYSVLNFLNGDGKFRITEKNKNLYILSGSKDLDMKTYDNTLLKKRIDQLVTQLKFKHILIDCAPQPLVDKRDSHNKPIPVLNELALVASDHIVVPLNADYYSVMGLSNFIQGILRVKKASNPKLDIAGVFFNKVVKTEKSFKRWRDTLESSPIKEYLFERYVRKDKTVEEAVDEGKSVFQVNPKCRAADDFRLLTEELLIAMNK